MLMFRGNARGLLLNALLSLMVLASCGMPAWAAITPRSATQASAATQVGTDVTLVSYALAYSGSAVQDSITVTRPTSVAAGHLLVAQLVLKGAITSGTVAPPGWTLLDSRATTGASPVSQYVYWRIATASEPASYTWSWPSNVRVVASITAFSNVEPTNPFDTWGAQTTNNSSTITLPTLTTSGSRSLLVAFLASSLGSTNNNIHSAPTGMNEYYEQASLPSGQPANGVTASAATLLQTSNGSTGTRTATISSGAADNIAHLLALRPRGALTIAVPAGTATGDVMVATVAYRPCSNTSGANCTTTVTTPSGWTLLAGVDTKTGGGTDGYGSRLLVYYRVVTGAEPASYTWYFAGNPVHAGAVGGIVSFTGVDTVNPIVAYAGQATPSGTNHTAPAINVGTVTGAMLVTAHSVNSSAGWTPPSGMTEQIDISSRTPPDALGISLEVNTQALSAGGNTGPRTAAFGGAADTGGTFSLALRPAPGGVTIGGFNAYDTTTPAGAITGFIKTKIAGQAFNLDLIALNTAKTAIETGFTGAVKVELLDASNNTGALDANGCRSSWTVIQTLSPNPNFNAGSNGRITVSFQENNAWRDVRVRVSYPATGTPTAVGCSNDNFAIRPASLTWTATDADWQTAGTARTLNNANATGGVVHKAGRPFTLTVTAYNALGNATTNYAGTPAATVTGCVLPAGCTAGTPVLGSFSGAGGTLVSTTASYPEVGAFSLRIEDTTFASVDSGDGSTAAERTIPGSTQTVGRFVPDHFELAPANTPQLKTFNDAACASRSFTYIGQPFGYVTAPVATVAAKNAAGGTTVNYQGSLWKLSAADVIQTYVSVPASPALTATTGAPTVTSNNDGTGSIAVNPADTLSYTRPGAAPWPAPFNAQISLSVSVQDAAENGPNQGVIATTVPAVFKGGGSGIAFDAGNEFRFGRLRLINAHGSERLPLSVPALAEYFDGTVFRTNTADGCTAIGLSALSFSNWQRNLNPGETAPAAPSLTLTAGKGSIPLSAPGVGNSGSVDLTLNVPAWLEFPWTGAGMTDPKARATFGIYRGGAGMIYRRESY